ncbi:hypothetical protein ES707_03855 [subsurface metagenome]
MSKSNDTIFEKWVDEAIEKVAKNGGWQKSTQKEVTLMAFGMLSRQLRSHMASLKKPFYWATGVITAGALSYIIGNLLG